MKVSAARSSPGSRAGFSTRPGRIDAGEAFTVDDPLAAETARRLAWLSDPRAQASALIGIEAIFPPRLTADPRFGDAVARQLRRLAELGAKGALCS
jgi:fructuronate reductase